MFGIFFFLLAMEKTQKEYEDSWMKQDMGILYL